MAKSMTNSKAPTAGKSQPQAQGIQTDLALHTLGWKSFQDLCAQICEECLQRPVEVFREAQDGGQDGAFRVIPTANSSLSGTVQCKFSGDPRRRLALGDLNAEKLSIQALVSQGQADEYYFITNMGVDGPVATDIKRELQTLGVTTPYVFGKEWITLQIKSSSRLRGLVPRIYGLGDLSVILDERAATQTRALLGNLMNSLKVYVPTEPHRKAVRTLSQHGIVLLLGDPAVGKSTLAAILATTALDGDGHSCFHIDGGERILENWNPESGGSLFWIDDAFGPNQLREDYVDNWIASMNKVKAAIAGGNRFILTSRSHIWNAAKKRLSSRNHQLLASGDAVVEVGALSPDERKLILYNHIKAGNQSHLWKRQVKPFLDSISSRSKLLPELARRLGDKHYTTGIKQFPNDIESFIERPKDYLIETINELSDTQIAALIAVFLDRSRLPVDPKDSDTWAKVSDQYRVSPNSLGEALNQLQETFVTKKVTLDGNQFWSFSHPTITDAISAILRARPDLIELYVRGTNVDSLLSETICVGVDPIEDSVLLPARVTTSLVLRLSEMPDEPNSNTRLFRFLERRASDEVLSSLLKLDETVLHRKVYVPNELYYDPKIRLYARLLRLGLLPDSLREETAERLVTAILVENDGSFLDNDNILSIIFPSQLLRLSSQIKYDLLEELPSRIEAAARNADLDIEPDSNFSTFLELTQKLSQLFKKDDEVSSTIDEIDTRLQEAIEDVKERKTLTEREWEGDDIVPATTIHQSRSRSVFSDVDD